MKVMLMVQNGDARPKCIGPVRHHMGQAIEDYRRVPGAEMAWVSPGQRAKMAPGRWWLVEAENAEAARFIIGWPMDRTTWPPPEGRILASGGKP